MPVNYDKLMAYAPDPVEQTYTVRDTMLYALGVGLGYDPLDEDQLKFVYEENLRSLPMMAGVLGYLRVADMNLGINYAKVLHGDQKTVFAKPIPIEGSVTSQLKIQNIIDRGEKGATIYVDRDLFDNASGDLLATVTMGIVARGEGGFGGPNTTMPTLHQIPDREPDAVVELPTLPQAALIYRLSADYNPLHADPKVAAKVGFERPILHGLATYGVAGHAVLRGICGYDTTKFKSLSGRFSAPVFPGETIRTDLWKDGETVSFRSHSVDRNIVVINNGKADVS